MNHPRIVAWHVIAIVIGLLCPVWCDAQDDTSPNRLAASPDGGFLAVARRQNRVDVFNTADRSQIQSLATDEPMISVALSDQGKYLAGGSRRIDDRCTLYLWERQTDGFALRWKSTLPGSCKSVAISPDAKWVAAVAASASIYFFDSADGQLRRTLVELGNEMGAGAFLPDGKRFVSGGQTLRLWDLEKANLQPDGSDRLFVPDPERAERERQTLIAALGSMTIGLSVAPNGRLIAAVGAFHREVQGRPCELVLVDPATSQISYTLTDQLEDVRSVAISGDSRLLAVGFKSGGVTVWDLGRREILRTLNTSTQPLECLTFVPGSKRLTVLSTSGQIEFWDVERNRLLE